MFHRICPPWLPGALIALAACSAGAQPLAPVSAPPVSTLKQAFDAAWLRQPEARSLPLQEEAALARRHSADRWTAEPPAIELSGKTDQIDRNTGSREYQAGIALPLWLPGERAAAGALADAELQATRHRQQAAQLRTAAAVRDAYWTWQAAHAGVGLEQARLANARQLAADVARRVHAGELARADQHQAEGAVASAEAALAEAHSTLVAARSSLRALTGQPVAPPTDDVPPIEPEPTLPTDVSALEETHPLLSEWQARSERARRALALAAVQTRANPELNLATTRERGAYGENWTHTVTVGLRLPFGDDARNRARIADASAEAVEAEVQLAVEHDRLLAELDTARHRADTARLQLEAAERRARLAAESRAFFDKAFRLGEADLPTRLRIELEASEAERQLARSRIQLAAARSALRQAMGLLPE